MNYYLSLWIGHFQFTGCLVSFLVLLFIIEISAFNANSLDPDQMPRSAASELGLTVFQYPFCGTLGINGLNRIIVQ